MTLTETARARVTFKFFNEVVQYADLNEMTGMVKCYTAQ
jgi:hypothetical protein